MTGGGAEGSPVEPILISDAERQAVVERLNASFSEGRLTHEEYSARLDQAYEARTDSDLQKVTRGLPAGTGLASAGDDGSKVVKPARSGGLRRQVEQVSALAVPGVITSGVWLAGGAHGGFWPAWVWLGTGVVLLMRFRRSVLRRNNPEWFEEHHQHHQHHQRPPNLGWSPPGSVGVPTVPGGPAPASQPLSSQRSVVTVVFVDIVDSSGHASRLGDQQWVSLLQRFTRVIDGVLASHDGHHVFTKGDEVVASFDSPDRAIRYAVAVREAIAPLGLGLHTGVHTGQVQDDSGQISGISLHIGQRVSALSAEKEILVSSTVRDITFGSGFTYVDRGEHELRGIDGQWHLYALSSTGSSSDR